MNRVPAWAHTPILYDWHDGTIMAARMHNTGPNQFKIVHENVVTEATREHEALEAQVIQEDAGMSYRDHVRFELAMDEMESRKALVTALEAVTAELRDVVKGEACDHSVGICWCETFRALELADEALKNAKE